MSRERLYRLMVQIDTCGVTDGQQCRLATSWIVAAAADENYNSLVAQIGLDPNSEYQWLNSAMKIV